MCYFYLQGYTWNLNLDSLTVEIPSQFNQYRMSEGMIRQKNKENLCCSKAAKPDCVKQKFLYFVERKCQKFKEAVMWTVPKYIIY